MSVNQGSSLIHDVVQEVGELKQRYSGEIQVHGSCGLAQTLIQHDLIDEYRLLIFSVILGTGKRLFGSGTVPSMLKLVTSSSTSKGTIVRWQQKGLAGLWDAPGRGTKAKWQEADMAYLEQCLEQQPRTYNSRQLSQKLEQERQVELSADRLRRILQKRALVGSEPVIVKEADKTLSAKPLSKQT